MATYDLGQLDSYLTGAGYDQAMRGQVENYLISKGFLTTPASTVDVESTQTPGANVEVLTGQSSIVVNTDPNLQYIIDPAVASGTTLTIHGSQSIGISLTTGTETVLLEDSGNDTVYAGRGNDTIDATGSTGNDSLIGGTGFDVLMGGLGHDLLIGGTGGGTLTSGSAAGGYNVLDDISNTAHTLYGGAGNDSLYAGGSGNDSLVAGSGNNWLMDAGSGTYQDTLTATGTTGNDTLIGGNGFDSLVGGLGHDLLIGGAGGGTMTSGSAAGGYNVLDDTSNTAHTLYGGAGDDSLYAAGSGNDSLQAGSGASWLQDVGTSGTYIDTLSAAGSSARDTLIAGSGNDLMIGGNTGDLFETGSGNDTIDGGSGNDVFLVNYQSAGGGAETIDGGGSGHNAAYFNDLSTDATINTNTAGVTTVTFTAGANAGQVDTVQNVQDLIFSDGTDHKL